METYIKCMNKVEKLFEECGFNSRMSRLRENPQFIEYFQNSIEKAEKECCPHKEVQNRIYAVLDQFDSGLGALARDLADKHEDIVWPKKIDSN